MILETFVNIGSRKFKCTTIPILREGFGLIGASTERWNK